MKRTFLILISTALLCSPLRAEETSGGLKLGLNIADFVGSDAGSSKIQKTGFIGGGYLVFPVHPQVKVQAECLISQKGAIYKWAVLDTVYEQIVRLTYLEFPVLARFDIKTRGGAKPAILVGPSFGIKISSKAESRSIGVSSTGTIDNIKAFDPGIALGGAVDVETGKGKVSLEARYTRSLVTISEKIEGETADVKNSVLSVMLGYRF
ncbi:MAG: hypothetical protein A2X31_04035 [Elusimicrobia bacterium GWB2_63_22]|nr:MAG: hypothetical protein A2X31_04035 [Elusimicrobia bacterium GWB2_63_22]